MHTTRYRRKNVKRRKREKKATTHIRNTNAEKQTTSKEGMRLNKNQRFKDEKF
jgi:hypothetical protein